MRMIKALTILLFVTGAALMTTTAQARDSSPYSNYNFTVVWDGVRYGGFTEVSGLATETEVIEYRDGNDPNQTARKIPGMHKVSNVTLKRGIISGNTELWDLRQQVVDGNVEDVRANGSIIMYDKNNVPVAEWEFQNAWPAKIEGPTLKADGNEVAIESLTIANESLVRIK